MKLRAYAYTNRGGRDHNEDSLRFSAEDGVFVLADGLGGHRCGEVASALAVDALCGGLRGRRPRTRRGCWPCSGPPMRRSSAGRPSRDRRRCAPPPSR